MAASSPVITGLGIIAAPGSGVSEIWRAMESGESGLKPLRLFQSPHYGQQLAGEVTSDLIQLGSPLRGSRTDRLAWLAARDAISSANLPFSTRAERSGVVLGSSVGGSLGSERFLTRLIKTGQMRPGPTRFHECVSAVDLIADDFGLFGPSMAVSTACSSGALAIATAAEMLQAGEADIMLAGGADSLSRMTWGGFHSLLLVDAKGCRPFDANRAGMSLGEGAAVLVIENEETALRRGATILARLVGWGASCDAHHATAPHPQGAGAAAAMQSALNRADLSPTAIDYVNAHGTGTRDNDLAESHALKTVFGDALPPVSSTKRFFGHSLAASGAIEAVVCIEALRRQRLPPNLGFDQIDPAIGLEPVTEARSARLRHLMSNSFGFGGNNAVLIFSQPNIPPTTRSFNSSKVNVVGLGLIGPGSAGTREIEPPLPAGSLTVHSCGPLVEAASLTPNQRRRMSRMTQMAVLAARRSLKPDPAKRLAVVIGTGFGCLEEGGIFLENLIAKDEREPMPARFPGSVHNAPSAQVAIDLGARGLNSAPTASEISFECALWQGMRQVAIGETDCALVGAVDELNKYPLSIGKRWGIWTEQLRPGEGAMMASLEAAGSSATVPLAQVTTVRLGRYRRPFDAEREADWIAESVDLTKVDVLLTGAKGWPLLDPMYASLAQVLSRRVNRPLIQRTYKDMCGEFHSASAFGFSMAVDMARQERRTVLLYTLALRGAKAICCLEPL
jgi:3-oxoacyl-(acyl-carrier-protein) synthase